MASGSLFGRSGPFEAYLTRFSEGEIMFDEGVQRVADSEYAVRGAGDRLFGTLGMVGGVFEGVFTPLTGTLDIVQSIFDGRGLRTTRGDRADTDYVVTLGALATAAGAARTVIIPENK